MTAAWFVVCVPPDKPDGPGAVFGPFHTLEHAERDANDLPCEIGSHVIVRGGGSTLVTGSCSSAWGESYVHYRQNPDEIPEACRHLFKSTYMRVQ